MIESFNLLKIKKYSTINSLVFIKISSNSLIPLSPLLKKYKVLLTTTFARRIFTDHENVFDIVDQNILLSKLDYCGIRGIANDWFKF